MLGTATRITRADQLAPVRIGCGRAVHLGCLSSVTGPDDSPRYTAAWCGAGHRDGDVTVGPAVAERITCRTCLRVQPTRIEMINTELAAEQTGPMLQHPADHPAYIAPLPQGGSEVWLLLHTRRDHGGHLITTAGLYLDPATAIGHLADSVRLRLAQMAMEKRDKPAGSPAVPPANDYELVARHFANPAPLDSPLYETYSLERREIDQHVTTRPGTPEYALVEPHGDLMCLCGNYATDVGFARAALGDGWESDYTACRSCGRVILAATGEVVSKLPECVNCTRMITSVPYTEVAPDARYPFVVAGRMWVHLDDEEVRCDGGTLAPVAAPEDIAVRICGVCGGDRSDRLHRHAHQHPRSEWSPVYANAHPAD